MECFICKKDINTGRIYQQITQGKGKGKEVFNYCIIHNGMEVREKLESLNSEKNGNKN